MIFHFIHRKQISSSCQLRMLEIYEACAHAGFIIRPFPNGIRITVGTREQNEGVISVLQQHFENKKESLEMRKMRKR